MYASHPIRRKLVALVAALAVIPVVAQEDEGKVFFSVSSDKTFGPGDTPQIQLWGQGVRSFLTEHPDGTWERVEHSPWRMVSYDRIDTLPDRERDHARRQLNTPRGRGVLRSEIGAAMAITCSTECRMRGYY